MRHERGHSHGVPSAAGRLIRRWAAILGEMREAGLEDVRRLRTNNRSIAIIRGRQPAAG